MTIPELTTAETARFWSKVHRADRCHLWTGEVNNQGYGRFAIYRKGQRVRILAHRLAYKLAIGTDPGPLVLRHRCDTPRCCNPDDLQTGTQAENIRDAIERNRLDRTGLDGYRRMRDERCATMLAAGIRKCTTCRVTKSLDLFRRSASNSGGRQYSCKSCMSTKENKGTDTRRTAA